jgi:hypothetical protein
MRVDQSISPYFLAARGFTSPEWIRTDPSASVSPAAYFNLSVNRFLGLRLKMR